LPLFEDVRIIVAKQLDVPPENLEAGTDLAEAGLGSLDVVELMFLLEDKYDVSLPYGNDRNSPAIGTIADIVAVLEKLGVGGAAA
jgi:acyl carrier protein